MPFHPLWCTISPTSQKKDLSSQAPHLLGNIIALLGSDGKILLVPLKASSSGGLRSNGIIELKERLSSQNWTLSSSLRFCYDDDGLLHLFAIDNRGKIVHKALQGFTLPPAPPPPQVSTTRRMESSSTVVTSPCSLASASSSDGRRLEGPSLRPLCQSSSQSRSTVQQQQCPVRPRTISAGGSFHHVPAELDALATQPFLPTRWTVPGRHELSC